MDPKVQGVASALISTGQQIGGAVGLAVIMAMISAGMGTNESLETMMATELNQAIRTAFQIAAVTTVLGIVVAFLVLKQPKASKNADTEVTISH